MTLLRALVPGGLERFVAWQRSFEAIGFGALAAARAAGDVELKRAYLQSRIQHVPDRLRRELRCVLDVGANEGQWASALLKLVSPSRMELFEPSPATHAKLVRNLGARPGLTAHAMALGSEPGELMLNVMERSDFSSLLEPAEGAGAFYGDAMKVSAQVAVRVETLDRMTESIDRIDLLKLDVQGYERHVLAGGARTLARTRALLIEANFVSHYASDDTFGSLADLLARSGFELWDFAPPFRAPNGRALWCDAVFVQPNLLPAEQLPR